MNKNSAGIIVSVRDITDVGSQSMVHCSLCGRDFIPSFDCDVFALEDRAGADGEMPLQCEVCMDRGFASEGIGVLDMSRPDATLADDPAEEWLRLLMSNTDTGPPHGALVHSDAVQRLALRFEDARDTRGLDLSAPVARLRELIASGDGFPSGADPRWRMGTLQAVGDALMEVSQWGLAREVHELVAREVGALGHDTMALHSIAQLACCDLFDGARDRAMARLAGLEWPKWEALARMAISVAADMARLEAVRYVCRRALGDAAADGSHVAVKAHLAVVSQIACADPKDRTEYLRALFAAVVSRDVNRVLSA